MADTAEQLAGKNREGLTLLLQLLGKLGVPFREIARKLGVSPPVVSYWASHKLRMSPEDQTKVYGLFAQAVTQRWPEDDVVKQQLLLPLMKRFVKTWQEATALEQALAAEAEDAHLKASIPFMERKVKSIEEWYAFEKAHNTFLAFREAQYQLAMTKDAWDTANQVIAKAEKVLGADTPPPTRKPRGLRRRSQRKRRAGQEV